MVPKSKSWSELVALDKSGNVICERKFNGYARAISADGKDVAVAGNFGNVTLINLDGKTIYTVPLIGYAYDVATLGGYMVVSYGKTVELIARTEPSSGSSTSAGQPTTWRSPRGVS